MLVSRVPLVPKGVGYWNSDSASIIEVQVGFQLVRLCSEEPLS